MEMLPPTEGDVCMPIGSGAPLLKTLHPPLLAHKHIRSADKARQGQTPGVFSACVLSFPSAWTPRGAGLSALLPSLPWVYQAYTPLRMLFLLF